MTFTNEEFLRANTVMWIPESVEKFDWVYNCPKLDYSGIKTDNKELWEGIEIIQLYGILPRD
jgi:hypothetical protein